jgi:hypothetical protein
VLPPSVGRWWISHREGREGEGDESDFASSTIKESGAVSPRLRPVPEGRRPFERQLVGVPEVAVLLGVTKQRACQIVDLEGFPPPVQRVAPLDEVTVKTVRNLFAEAGGTITVETALGALYARWLSLPESPRLWRLELVRKWAEDRARGDKSPPE